MRHLKGFLFLLASAIMLVSCNNGNSGPSGYLRVHPDLIQFGIEGGTYTVVVTGEDWIASTANDWITLSATSGTADGAFDVTVDASNQQKTGTITVTNTNGQNAKTITVKMPGKPEDPRGYEFISATGFFRDQWIPGAGTFLVYLRGYERDANNNPVGEGYLMFMNIISFRAVLGHPIIEIPEGLYPFSEVMAWDTVFLGIDGGTDMLTGIEWITPGQTAPDQRLLSGGSLIVSGSARNYLLEINMEFQDGSTMKAFYEGPLLVQNHYDNMLSTLTEDRTGLTSDHGILENTGGHWFPDVYSWNVKMFSDGLSINERGFLEGSGYYVDLELNKLNGLDNPTGSYSFEWDPLNNPYGPGTASAGTLLFDPNRLNDGRIGSWYYEIEDGDIVNMAPFKTGTVVFGTMGSDNSATCSVTGVDDQGHTISLNFNGMLDVIEYIPL